MATLEIKKYGDPVLRKKCREVEKTDITPEIQRLIEDMKETMEKNEGVGLAHPQIGGLKRIIIVQTEKGPLGFINPRIVKKTKETEIMEEGCLSLPGVFLKIKRRKGVEIKALDKEGGEVQIKTEGLAARIFQHEIDHLNGVLIIDRISFFQKLRIRTRLRRNFDSLR